MNNETMQKIMKTYGELNTLSENTRNFKNIYVDDLFIMVVYLDEDIPISTVYNILHDEMMDAAGDIEERKADALTVPTR